MKAYRKISLSLILMLAAGCVSGCGAEEEETNVKNPYAAAVSMESTPIVDYVVPRLLPNVLVDTKGYALGDQKTAAVRGRRLPEEFRLVDDATGETVYCGAVESVTYHGESDLYSGVIDFSEADTEGTYYLECDIIGRSYCFSIQEQLYNRLFLDNYEQMMESCQKKTWKLSEAVALLEASKPEFKEYAQQIVKNCKALAEGLVKRGNKLVSGGTDNHVLLMDLRDTGVTGKELEARLDECYITVNKNTIPNEPLSPFVTSGIRIGTAAVTTRGLKEEDMDKIAEYITLVLNDFENSVDKVRAGVEEICKKYPLYE